MNAKQLGKITSRGGRFGVETISRSLLPLVSIQLPFQRVEQPLRISRSHSVKSLFNNSLCPPDCTIVDSVNSQSHVITNTGTPYIAFIDCLLYSSAVH